jgi:hypothetical protein
MPASFNGPVYADIAAGALRIADVENSPLRKRGQWHPDGANLQSRSWGGDDICRMPMRHPRPGHLLWWQIAAYLDQRPGAVEEAAETMATLFIGLKRLQQFVPSDPTLVEEEATALVLLSSIKSHSKRCPWSAPAAAHRGGAAPKTAARRGRRQRGDWRRR